MIFIKRFRVPDVSMTAYVGFDEAYGTNAGLFDSDKKILSTGYSYPGDRQ